MGRLTSNFLERFEISLLDTLQPCFFLITNFHNAMCSPAFCRTSEKGTWPMHNFRQCLSAYRTAHVLILSNDSNCSISSGSSGVWKVLLKSSILFRRSCEMYCSSRSLLNLLTMRGSSHFSRRTCDGAIVNLFSPNKICIGMSRKIAR